MGKKTVIFFRKKVECAMPKKRRKKGVSLGPPLLGAKEKRKRPRLKT